MYIGIVKTKDGKETLVTLKSENRNNMRYLKILCTENELPCEITEEARPRAVKFKGVD